MNSAANEFDAATMSSVLPNQVMNGHWSLFSSSSKFAVENDVGTMQVTASSPVLSGGQAAVSVFPPENARLIT